MTKLNKFIINYYVSQLLTVVNFERDWSMLKPRDHPGQDRIWDRKYLKWMMSVSKLTKKREVLLEQRTDLRGHENDYK